MSNTRVICVIPARLAATRLPDKPLADICGKPMIQHVWERAMQATCVESVVVATPDQAIIEAVLAFGGHAVLTSDKHRSGTDRLAEVAEGRTEGIFVNVQGDEPLIDPASIDLAVGPLLRESDLQMTSLMCACPAEEQNNPATVKVVCDLAGNALYFSRSLMPFPRNADGGVGVFQHIGLYAYRREFLLRFAAMPPGKLELTESLEQLRVLENGVKIRMAEVDRSPLSVDTPEDLERVRAIIKAG
ncbi:MAG: 3-deoxy-manno-octulosonate cytidylyltransferase [Chthonomonadales bacterium]